jgi:hypothetical protein
MSLAIAPEFVTGRSAANAAAAADTSNVVAAGADDVSEAVASVFGAHAQAYQVISAQTATFHEQFVQLLSAGAGAYSGAEAANVSPLQSLAANAAETFGWGNTGNGNIGIWNYGVGNLGIANNGYHNVGG